jgi:hypothetical protein
MEPNFFAVASPVQMLGIFHEDALWMSGAAKALRRRAHCADFSLCRSLPWERQAIKKPLQR